MMALKRWDLPWNELREMIPWLITEPKHLTLRALKLPKDRIFSAANTVGPCQRIHDKKKV